MSVALALLTAHALGDFPLQADWHAARKFDEVTVRAHHAVIHGLLTFAALAPLVPPEKFVPAGVTVLVCHFAIDTRRWAAPKDGFEDYPIWVDQSLHVASLYAVSVVVL